MPRGSLGLKGMIVKYYSVPQFLRSDLWAIAVPHRACRQFQ